ITCHVGDSIWNMSDEDLINDTVDALDELKVISKDDVIFSDLTRMTPAYVIYDKEHDRNIKTVKDFIKKQGIELCGRFGEFEYLNMDACIERAASLAERIK
ncbi:MAG: FAD-dependent oxidoreductase, partial [Methanobacteriota archaeon]